MPRLVDNWIEGFLEYTDNTEPRINYRKWVAISTLAAVLQRKCYLKWGRETFYPNMYIVLVGPPAARKGTAMKEGGRFLKAMGIEVSADESSRQKLIQAIKAHSQVASPTRGHIEHHSSITIFSTELTVFLGYESKELLAMLCKWFDCEERYIYDTVSRGRDEVANVWCNLLGATTPGQLQVALPEGAVGSGFTSRVVFVYEEDKEKVIIKPEISPSQEVLGKQLSVDLGEIRNIYGEFTVDESFDELYAAWRFDSENRNLFTEPRLDYYIQRRPTHIFKLALIYSAARGGSKRITGEDLAYAIESLNNVELKMPKVFEGIGNNPLAGLQLRLLKVIKAHGVMSTEVIAQDFTNDANNAQLGEALGTLESMGYVRADIVNRTVTYTKDRKVITQ